MDYSIFNELSAKEPAENVHTAREWMKILLETCKTAKELGFRQLKTREDFTQTLIADQYAIYDWLADKTCVDSSLKILLRGLIQSPCIGSEIDEEAYLLMKKICIDNGEGEDAEGLGVAYLTETLSVSFASHSRWEQTEIPLIYTFQTENGKSDTKTKNVTVRHACKPDHIETHKSWALKLNRLGSPRPLSDNPLPSVEFSDMLVSNDWDEFRERLKKYPKEKNGMIIKMAENVAEINGYKFNPELSSCNQERKDSLRQIFEAGKGRDKIYLSTDFEKGAFEVCDYRGKHLGEYSFEGKRTQQADRSGSHDICIPKKFLKT